MRKRNGISILETREEMENFRGIVLTRKPSVMFTCEATEISEDGKRCIGEINTMDLYGGRGIKKEVEKLLEEKSVPDIAILSDMSYIFDI